MASLEVPCRMMPCQGSSFLFFILLLYLYFFFCLFTLHVFCLHVTDSGLVFL